MSGALALITLPFGGDLMNKKGTRKGEGLESNINKSDRGDIDPRSRKRIINEPGKSVKPVKEKKDVYRKED